MNITVTANGRMVIPASLRRQFGIIAGTRIHIEVDEEAGQIILTPITRAYIRSLRGKYRGRGVLQALEEDRKREREL